MDLQHVCDEFGDDFCYYCYVFDIFVLGYAVSLITFGDAAVRILFNLYIKAFQLHLIVWGEMGKKTSSKVWLRLEL